MEVVEAAAVEVGIARDAVFAAAAVGIHGVLEVDDDFQAVVLEAGDGLPGHEQVFFGRGFEGLEDVEEAGLDDQDGDRDAVLAGDDELDVCPVLDAGATAAGTAEEGQLHCSGVGGIERGGEAGDEVVGAGETNLRVVDAEGGHALEQADGGGQGDIDIGLLHSVAQTGFKQLDLWRACLGHRFVSWPAEGACQPTIIPVGGIQGTFDQVLACIRHSLRG